MSTSKIFLNYTDWHDVDEEMRTISISSGYWDDRGGAGAARREMHPTSISTFDTVASLKT